MAAKQKILIVDDDANIAELISLYLTKECYETMIVNDGEEALSVFKTFQPNLILLDLMLPGIDGYQVCREIRSKSSTPIIMLSAKGEVFDKVLGLELGADDYIIKPFDSKELVARVKAVLRRYQPAKQEAVNPSAKIVEYPDLVINQTNYSVLYQGCLLYTSDLASHRNVPEQLPFIRVIIFREIRQLVNLSDIMAHGRRVEKIAVQEWVRLCIVLTETADA